MLALRLYIDDVRVTVFACFMAREFDRTGSNFAQSRATIVAVPAKGLRHHVTADQEKREKG
jgi:hypothetical protein